MTPRHSSADSLPVETASTSGLNPSDTEQSGGSRGPRSTNRHRDRMRFHGGFPDLDVRQSLTDICRRPTSRKGQRAQRTAKLTGGELEGGQGSLRNRIQCPAPLPSATTSAPPSQGPLPHHNMHRDLHRYGKRAFCPQVPPQPTPLLRDQTVPPRPPQHRPQRYRYTA